MPIPSHAIALFFASAACLTACAQTLAPSNIPVPSEQTAAKPATPSEIKAFDVNMPLTLVTPGAPALTAQDLKTLPAQELEDKLFAYAMQHDFEPLKTLRERAKTSELDKEIFAARVARAIRVENYERVLDENEIDTLMTLPELKTSQGMLGKAFALRWYADNDPNNNDNYATRYGIDRADFIEAAFQKVVQDNDINALKYMQWDKSLGKQEEATDALTSIYLQPAEKDDPEALYEFARAKAIYHWQENDACELDPSPLLEKKYELSLTMFSQCETPDKLLYLLKKSADQGYAPAELALGQSLARHRKTSLEGIKYLQEAIKHGNKTAAQVLAYKAVYSIFSEDYEEADQKFNISREEYDYLRNLMHYTDQGKDEAELNTMQLMAEPPADAAACMQFTFLGFTEQSAKAAQFSRKMAPQCWMDYIQQNVTVDICDAIANQMIYNDGNAIAAPLMPDEYAERLKVIRTCYLIAAVKGSTYEDSDMDHYAPPVPWKLASHYRSDTPLGTFQDMIQGDKPSASPVEEHAWLVYGARPGGHFSLKGDAWSQFTLAQHYEKGIDLKQDKARACYWYSQVILDDDCKDCFDGSLTPEDYGEDSEDKELHSYIDGFCNMCQEAKRKIHGGNMTRPYCDHK